MMNNSVKKLLSVILCIVLIAAMALCATGCTDTELPAHSTDPTSTPTAAVTFTFVVVDLDGTETSFEISSDAETVGEALLAEGLIAGEDSEYGLYVKEVNGIVADYDVDETYWAFYVDGEYALTGVDATAITAGSTYSFVKTGPEASGSDVTILGEGATVFNFSVVDLEGAETKFEIHTDETTVGAALLALELVEGSMGDYGLYVTAVNGIAADWDADQTYWAFYVDGEYALAGVDATEISAGAAYSFVLTKG